MPRTKPSAPRLPCALAAETAPETATPNRHGDIFEIMLSKDRLTAGEVYAVRLLQGGLAAQHRIKVVSLSVARVDNSRRPELYDAALLDGIGLSAAIREVLSRCGDLDGRLLMALLEPASRGASLEHWRQTVRRVSSNTPETEQTSLIRFACANLQAALTSCPKACRALEKAAAC